MAVLHDRKYEEDMPKPDWFFSFIIYRDEESLGLTNKEVAAALLSNVTAVRLDNTDDDPLVGYYACTAEEMGIESIELNYKAYR